MNEKVIVKRELLEAQTSDIDYLIVIFDKLREVSFEDSEAFFTESNTDQISLMVYTYLYDQVHNGGFIQLIFNGYTSYIFNSPLSQSLRLWGAVKTADLLDRITDDALKVQEYLVDKEFTAEVLSDTYPEFPQFEAYDKEFYDHTGIPEIKKYVSENIGDFTNLA